MKDWGCIFKALPHINKIWVTEDGNFHLHPNYGGDEIDRESVKNIELENDELKENTEEQKPRSKGRPKLN